MSRELLLDVDGVVIRPRNKYFSETYSEDYGVPLEDILPFFKGEYKKAAIGEIDIKIILPAYLAKWGWKGTIEEFLQYWFEKERDVDEKVLGTVRDLRQKGVKVYLVSDNEANRANYLMNEVSLKDKFDGSFFSSDLGITKSDPDFYKKVVEKLQIKPEEITYFDDDQKNVDVAKALRIDARLYKTANDLKDI